MKVTVKPDLRWFRNLSHSRKVKIRRQLRIIARFVIGPDYHQQVEMRIEQVLSHGLLTLRDTPKGH